MKEFKFRAWNSIVKRFKYFTFPDLEKQDGAIQWHILKIQQFIGVKDRNGTEIYEGDIVEAWNQGSKGIFEIRFRCNGSPSYILYPAFQHKEIWYISATEHRPGTQFISVNGEVSTTQKEETFDDGLEIIGNIFQTPEILSKS